MVELIMGLLSGGGGYLAAFGFIIVTLFGVFMKGRMDGSRLERQKNEALVRRALEERMKMNKEAVDIRAKVAAMTDAEIQAEIEKWSRR